MKVKILVLIDERTSNKRQSVALLREIVIYLKKYNYDVSFNSKKIKTYLIRFIPNILILVFGYVFAKLCCFFVKKDQYDIIISCGRRLAILNYLLALMMKNKAKTISILNPNIPIKMMDLCLIPSHDEMLSNNKNNIVYFNGSLSYFDNKATDIQNQLYCNLKKMSPPYISVFVGGPSDGAKMSYNDMNNLAVKINDIAIEMDATLIISTSRRTPKNFNTIVKNNLRCSYYFYDIAKHDKRHNPYDACMLLSNYFIVTGDSISMISEAVNRSKPVYIFTNETLSPKHLRFHRILYDKSCAFNLSSISGSTLLNYVPNKLNDMKIIAQDVMNMIKL